MKDVFIKCEQLSLLHLPLMRNKMNKNLTPQTKDNLVQEAIQALEHSYSSYSNYAVGAALLTTDGQIFRGANIENAVYPLTICAERVAVFKAVSEGNRSFQAIAVATKDGGSPCGSCRQVLAEFGLDTDVIITDTHGKIHHQTTVGELLPHSFGPENLKTKYGRIIILC